MTLKEMEEKQKNCPGSTHPKVNSTLTEKYIDSCKKNWEQRHLPVLQSMHIVQGLTT